MKEKKMKNDQKNENMSLDINTDENVAGTTHLNEAMTEESETEKLKEELREQKDKYLRLYAEFENYRKRSAREKVELIQTASKEVISSLLEVLDDSDRAEKQLQNGNTEEIEGLKLVFNKLRLILQSKGLRPMETIGKEFDPDLHEAISEIPAPTEELKGKVVDELVKGYYLNDKIIRFAKVVVGK